MKRCQLLSFITFLVINSCHSQVSDNDIVLVNVGNYDKVRIANEIEIINELNPKVIAVDIAFPHYEGGVIDERLVSVLKDCRKLVMASTLRYSGKDYYGNEILNVASASSIQFVPFHAKKGFVSSLKRGTDAQTPLKFMTWQKGYSGDVYYHFSIVTAMSFDSVRTVDFIENHERLVNVKYNKNRQFIKFSTDDVLKGKLTKKDIEGKIVMIGFLGPGNEDKFFSPFNRNGNEPDMYGVEYLANIVAQILECAKK